MKWTRTVASLGLAGFHFHDLRHTGHPRRSQHATSERGREIVQAMDRRTTGNGRRRP
ncbi:hypothetical protein OG470_00070 [Micromonospora sp. NBC_00389]|uniref:hypothetical protein n=1 Tax=Micromonospora sp. NBC_00389 TaxID=2903586 RepID=UPI002E24596C